MQYNISIFDGLQWIKYKKGELFDRHESDNLFLVLYEIALFCTQNVYDMEIFIEKKNGESKVIKMSENASTVLSLAIGVKDKTIEI